MKKIFSAMSLILGLGLATAQQTAPATSTTAHQTVKTVKATKPVEVKAAKPAEIKTAKPAEVKPAQPAAKMKKDGTPDKRYKDNKHLKKDGTPDKRYKVNK
ncbi:hypothetical protein J2787_002321 [Chryseobacterium rhizosphaerae]|jgi:hypothetical protein|uniref:Uncharacterized protein n=1 Tax=Chryseobacterium rhizosphaerae TaxID=395937 RepID=A0AAE3YB74_9FLAO|nr:MULTISPECIES: hypothetical protein [Chryseobacterium]MBL3546842.1 hypothetical protein [Chryseobacterium sp. KMC2]MDR6526941.1 hypothetical protein [Chryseobacterium rhizosphaerae]